MAAISLGSYFSYLHWDRVKKPMKKRTVQEASQPKTDIGKKLIKTTKKSPRATRKTPRKSDKKLEEADKHEKACQKLEDMLKFLESNKPVKGMDEKLEKVKKGLDQDK